MLMLLTILLWVGACAWLVFCAIAFLNAWMVDNVSKQHLPPPARWPSVSIVVPARDEQRGIRAAVSSFCVQDYPDLEVIVVDDGSTDRTPAILADLAAKHANLRVIQGVEPPTGWLGKPNALEHGRRAARGEWILFVDADIVYTPDLVRRAITHALHYDLAMLVLTPRMITGGILEAVVLSAILLIGLTVFPVFLVRRSRSKLFAAGSGVFNMVRRDALVDCNAFECLKSTVLDDVGLGYQVKAAGHRVDIAVATGHICVRMYEGFRETVEGFTKSVYPMMRGNPALILVPFATGVVLSLLPYSGFLWFLLADGVISVPAVISLVLLHLTAVRAATFFGLPWQVALLGPLRELLWWYILLRSCVLYHRRGIVWRGRQYESGM